MTAPVFPAPSPKPPPMRLDGSNLVLAPTDLAGFPECGQRTLLDRLKALGKARYPEYEDPRLDLIRERGMEHERAYLAGLRRQGKRIVEFEAPRGADWSDEGMRRRMADTLEAMRSGADVIYQGTLYDGRWRGLVDFLLRVERPSALGVWSYEVADAKLAREAKASAILQTCVYSEMLAVLQGVEPEQVHLYLGGPAPRLESFRLAHFGAYYRGLKRRFLEHLEGAGDEPPFAPEPVEACRVCDWKPRCDAERREADHLALVAGIRRDQRGVLEAMRVRTLAGLAELPLDPAPEGLRDSAFRRVREQARVQREGRERGEPVWELLPLEFPGGDGWRTGSTSDGRGTGPEAGGAVEGGAAGNSQGAGHPQGAGDSQGTRHPQGDGDPQGARNPDGAAEASPSPAPPPTGLAALPAPTPHDLFLDLEGADHAGGDEGGDDGDVPMGGGGGPGGEAGAGDGGRDPETGSTPGQGLEYLWGVSDVEDRYQGRWAITSREEREALLAFLRRAVDHLEGHPGAHIYHYGHYEPVALKRLVGRYGVGTDELDTLLKKEVFVDLHRVVKQGIRASVESYSLKPMEGVVGFQRTTPLNEATRARIRLEVALASGVGSREELVELGKGPMGGGDAAGAGADPSEPPHPPSDLDLVEGYNRDDCVSLRVLRDWLEERRRDLELQEGRTIPRPPPPEPREDREEDIASEVRELMERLLDGVPDEEGERLAAWSGGPLPEAQVRWLMAHLLEWHRREDKSAWWEYFRWREMSDEELVAEGRPLGGLVYEGEVGTVARSILHQYRFPPQEHRFEAGDRGKDPRTEKVRSIHSVDEGAGTLELLVGKGTDWDPAALTALIPDDIIGTKQHRARLRESAHRLLDGPGALAEWSPASLALLERTHPRFRVGTASPPGVGGDEGLPGVATHGPPGPTPPTAWVHLPLLAPGQPLAERAVEAVLRMAPGVLPVQGPPGTGKTYTGARMIRALLEAGLRVGVTGPSHKVITNLLRAVCGPEGEGPDPLIRGLQVKRAGEEGCTHPSITRVDGSGSAPKAEADRAAAGLLPFNLVAGTSWFWAADDRRASMDVLFIDEAGQFSLANALAVAPAAPRLVLLGDPQQLNQVQRGIHPPGTDVSVLEHLAGEDGILSSEQGLFLGMTWRMHPRITVFTSELFYEGKLGAREELGLQRILVPSGKGGVDVPLVPAARGGGAVDRSGAGGAGREWQGLHFVEVPHAGNSRESEEEVQAVVALFRELLGREARFTDRDGDERKLVVNDLLVVAPYNAQVDRIRRALEAAGHRDPRVGTVDRFQGQEAPVAVYSLASSSAADAPRGMDFLFALDRLNVATSRARALTVVVASPALLDARARHPRQIRMVNGLLRYREMARVW